MALASIDEVPVFVHLSVFPHMSYLRAVHAKFFGVGVHQELNIPTLVNRVSGNILRLSDYPDAHVS